MTRIINLSNTQFRYQLVFFIHIHGYIWLAEGCLWHLLSRQNLLSTSFAQAKHATWQYLLPGGMFCLLQCNATNKKISFNLLYQIYCKNRLLDPKGGCFLPTIKRSGLGKLPNPDLEIVVRNKHTLDHTVYFYSTTPYYTIYQLGTDFPVNNI